MKRFVLFQIILILAMFFGGCSKNSTNSSPVGNANTIKGVITIADSLKDSPIVVGILADSILLSVFVDPQDSSRALPFFDGSYVVMNEVKTSPGTTNRQYSLQLPEDPDQMGRVIAFIDKNNNLKWDTQSETAKYPIKEYQGKKYVIRYWGYFQLGGSVDYLIFLNNENLGLSIVGNDGFNFYF